MSETDSTPKGGRLSWWPKLLLWAVVIAFGVAYLGSTKRRADEAQISAHPPVAPKVDVPAIAQPPEASPTAAEAVVGAGEATRPSVPAADAAPVQAAESAAFARSLMQAEPSRGMETEPAADPVSTPAAPAQDVPPDGPPSDPMDAEQSRVPEEHQAMRPATAGPTYPQWGPPAMPVPYGYPAQGYPPQGHSPQGHSPQGYPAQGYPAQGYPAQGHPSPVPGAYPPR